MSVRGIDVAHWQDKINWEAVKAAGDQFALIKATDGTEGIDIDLALNRTAARAAKILPAFYHYPEGGDPTDEADWFCEHSGRRNGEGQVLDYEGVVLKVANPVDWALGWLNRAHKNTDNRPLIYMSLAVVTRFNWAKIAAAGFELDVASWNPSTPGHGKWPHWEIWQTSDHGRVPGVNGPVDTDVLAGTLAGLAKLFVNDHGPAPKPAPVPKPRPVKPSTYLVRDGDTLGTIAHHFGTTVAKLIAWNKRKYPKIGTGREDLVDAGWIIRVR